jgi:hypothetical protein
VYNKLTLHSTILSRKMNCQEYNRKYHVGYKNQNEKYEYNTDISVAKQSNSMPQHYKEKSNTRQHMKLVI